MRWWSVRGKYTPRDTDRTRGIRRRNCAPDDSDTPFIPAVGASVVSIAVLWPALLMNSTAMQ